MSTPHTGSTPNSNDPANTGANTLTGSQVIDPKGQPVGKVKDVVYDGSDNAPTWLVVKPGLLQAEHYVPVRGAYRTDTDNVVVPFDRQMVKSAPKAASDHVVTSEQRALLVQHYHLMDA